MYICISLSLSIYIYIYNTSCRKPFSLSPTQVQKTSDGHEIIAVVPINMDIPVMRSAIITNIIIHIIIIIMITLSYYTIINVIILNYFKQ